MSVEVLDGATVRSFVEDDGAFNRSVDERFAALDVNKNGALSVAEMARELTSLRVMETRSRDGTVDLEEFRAEVREVMLAVASGLGFMPVQMVVHEGSFLHRAVEREAAMLVA